MKNLGIRGLSQAFINIKHIWQKILKTFAAAWITEIALKIQECFSELCTDIPAISCLIFYNASLLELKKFKYILQLGTIIWYSNNHHQTNWKIMETSTIHLLFCISLCVYECRTLFWWLYEGMCCWHIGRSESFIRLMRWSRDY